MAKQISFFISGPGQEFEIGNTKPLIAICGPCVIEGEKFALDTAQRLKDIFERESIPFIYKSSFDKANRSSIDSYRGVGIKEGLRILNRIREEIGVPVLTDVHTIDQVTDVAEVVDILQTPAFLCRQTDFITTVATSGKTVNIKKGQFMSPYEMHNVYEKATRTGNNQICLCERGSSFGYGNLVVDMKGFSIMAETGAPIIFDATHSVQMPGALGKSSGGDRRFVPGLASAAVAIGVAGVFIEAHPNPDNALSDGPNMMEFSKLSELLKKLKEFDQIAKGK
jgi:2-dehydro-3-deoxyphosphooctonate aldolase (KDO 8-P synthase)